VTEKRVLDVDLLPPGPGLRARWLVAVPLMVLSTVLPTLGQMVLSAWTSLSFNESLPDFGDPAPVPTFWDEFREDLDALAGVAVLPGVVLLVFLLRRSLFPAWPKACLWLGLWVLAPATLFGSVLDQGDATMPNLAIGVGILWLSYELGRLTVRVLSRPVARDIALAELDIPYPVPGSRARLRVRRDGVRLDRLKAARGTVHKDIRWAELREARVDELDEPMSWQAGPRTLVEVPAGPVLRITGANQKWVLPVTEAMGEDLAAVIALRVHNRT
jgi:hypothetical protein